MRRFVVYFPGPAGLDGKAWEDVGFSLVEAETGLETEKQPDVVFWRQSWENSLQTWPSVKRLLPKLYITVGNHGIPVPDNLSDIYERQLIPVEGLTFTIGTRIQGNVAIPAWDAYGSGGKMSPEEQVQAVAGSIYQHHQ